MEVSRLLSQNLDLREEIAQLQSEVSTASLVRSHVDSSVSTVRHQLEAKLKEFSTLVLKLDDLQPDAEVVRAASAANKDQTPSARRPEIPRCALSGQSQILSQIVEEKASPGGTLQSVFSLQPSNTSTDRPCSVVSPRAVRLSNQSNESPDLGPPPVAHFECDDPIKFDVHSQSNEQSADEDPDDSDAVHAYLSVNLETRRRRRDTHSKSEPKSTPAILSDTHTDEPRPRPTSKRKLSICDVDELNVVPPKDDFVFSRRSSVNGDIRRNQSNSEPSVQGAETEEEPAVSLPQLAAPAERKVLGDSMCQPFRVSVLLHANYVPTESVNMSPRKVDNAKNTKGDVVKPVKASARGQGRERKPRTSSIKPLQSSEPVLKAIELPPPEPESSTATAPKTPSPDIFSPTPSEPSASRLDGRDTPPPSRLDRSNTTSSALNGASRPSRRARASINYAEPNLVSKMRRPSENPANAVALGATRRSISNVPDSEGRKTMRTVVIKHEEATSSDWKTTAPSTTNNDVEAASPLGKQTNKAQEQELKRIEINQQVKDTKIEDEEENDKLEMDVYNFTESSPENAEAERQTKRPSSRRHSTIVGRDSSRRRASKVQQQLVDGGKDQDPQTAPSGEHDETAEAAARPRRAERVTGRRRSMMV